MTPIRQLKLISAVAAVAWTIGMVLWTGTDIPNIIVLSVCGVLFGVLWYFAMRWWLRWRGILR